MNNKNQLFTWIKRARIQRVHHTQKKSAELTRMNPTERQAYNRFFVEHQELIEFLCRDVIEQCNDKALETQDLISESFILLKEVLTDYDNTKGNIKSYIGTALRNKLVDFVKYRKRHDDLSSAAPPYNNEPAKNEHQPLLPSWIDVNKLAQRLIDQSQNTQNLKAFWSRLYKATAVES